MPKVRYNPITKQNEWTYSKEEKEEMLKELEKKPKRVLAEEKTIQKNSCGIRGYGNGKHIPFNPHAKDSDETFNWGNREEN